MSTSPSQPVKRPEPISHINGKAWYEMPLPRRWHRCRPQSRGSLGSMDLVERCACGGARLDGAGPWHDKNSRRDNPSEAEATTPETSLGADVQLIGEIEAMLRDLGKLDGTRRG